MLEPSPRRNSYTWEQLMSNFRNVQDYLSFKSVSFLQKPKTLNLCLIRKERTIIYVLIGFAFLCHQHFLKDPDSAWLGFLACRRAITRACSSF